MTFSLPKASAAKQATKAIDEFRKMIAIEQTFPRSRLSSAGHYGLAKALTLANRPKEALEAFRAAIRWDPGSGELGWTEGIYVVLDYVMALARAGRLEDAKAVYYSYLRKQTVNALTEPFPFLVVFDDDPNMATWALSEENLIAVATMLLAQGHEPGGTESVARAEAVRLMKPDWIMPAIFLASVKSEDWRRDLELARKLARSQEERQWVTDFQRGDIRFEGESDTQRWERINRLSQIGVERRKSSVVLEKGKEMLKDNWRKVAGSSW